ncbi:two-component system NarL family sensor kinase [Chryseobacterium sp. H1D6B]|uniref:ATP-binding protein n=1 Tax=Chryseobacterium sp. H1D6B TaxID=2940588 RepID=UPI0015C7AA5D|nr:ATP-binding protein [Chryseobacterium sp. H1D6B]MDH6252434.1 two-component system NarL family sensor kinase [Chryseobacterium sp. H1D6B]
MMKRVFILLNILYSFSLISQQIIPLNEKPYVDNLNNIVKDGSGNSIRANAYFLLSSYYRNTDSVLSKKHLESGRFLSNGNAFLSAKYYYYEGQYHLEKDKEKASQYFQKSIKELAKFKTEESNILQSLAWYNYGVAQKNKKGYPFLIKIMLEKSIPLVEKYENSKNLGFLYTQLAIVLTYNAEFEKAENYNNKAIEILQKDSPNSAELFYAYLSSSSNFCYQAKGDKAKNFLDKAEKMIQPYPESSANAYYLYGKILYLITKQKNEETLPVIEQGLVYAKKFNQNLLAQMFYLNKYDILRKLKRYTEAKNVLQNILKEKTLVIDANNRKTIFRQLSNLNEEMGNSSDALVWERKYSKLNDSLNSENIKLEINTLEKKFNTAEKERKIATLNAEKNQKELEVNKKNSYLWGLGLSLLLIISLFVLFMIIYRKNNKISEQKEINLQQKIKDIRQKEELTLTKAILESEERERERIARDLHDGLGGMLAGVKINLSSWSSNYFKEENTEFSKILQQLDRSVGELRYVARNLMPESLLNFGLETALNDLCEFYTRTDLEIDFQPLNIESTLSLPIQVNIYRIVQELLANAVKHSGGSHILLQCSQSEDHFMITVEDDGEGFAEDIYKTTNSMGIRNLRNRVDYLKGKIEINSDNEGTVINIELDTHAI